jgi:regulatory protein
LRDALEGDFLPPDIDGALARLHELGYLDDRAWAARYVDTARAGGRGEAVLRRVLRSHGVSDEDIADALDSRDDGDAALAAARRRVRGLRALDDDRQQRRLYDFLRRRGFGDGVARRAMETAVAEARAALEEPSTTR